MAKKYMTPKQVVSQEADEFLKKARTLANRNRWQEALEAAGMANAILRPYFDILVAETGITVGHDNVVGSEMSEVSLLDLLAPKRFLPHTVQSTRVLENTLDAEHIVRIGGFDLGSTAQFLTYLQATPRIHIPTPLVHLGTKGYSGAGQPAYLYVAELSDTVAFSLANARGYQRHRHYNYFGVKNVK